MKMNKQRGMGLVQQVWLVAGLLVILALAWHMVEHYRTGKGMQFSTPYQAVQLTNGALFFGQLHGYGGPNPTLTDVYFIVSQTNPDTKQVNNVLVRRMKEAHAPEIMYLNPNAVLFVEPVGQNSKVSQLISQGAQ
jgi:hypothetical protein